MRYFIALFFLCPFFVFAQNFSDNWEDLYSYYQIQDVAYSNGKVFAAAENAVLSYQRGTGETEKISSIQGLSGESISAIHFSDDYNLLIIGYQNGLIDVYNIAEKSVLTVIDIVEKQTIPPSNKKINHFSEDNNRLYISTNYGISVFDLANLEFGDTYFIGDGGSQLAVSESAIYQNTIYAATQGGGIRYANADNPNLIDYNVWQNIGQGNIKAIAQFDEKLYAVNTSNSLLRIENNTIQFVMPFNNIVNDFRVNENLLVVTTSTTVKIYNAAIELVGSIIINDEIQPRYNVALLSNNNVYIGDANAGLLQTSLTNPLSFSFLSPNSPLRNDVFNMDAIPNELWLVYGEYTNALDPYPLNSRGVSHLKGDTWINIPFEELSDARSITHVTINPNNPSQVFISSFFSGLLEMNDNELVNLYTGANSNLSFNEDPAANSNDIRINGTAFDRQGNLWVTNSRVQEGLAKLPEGGTDFTTYDVTDVIPDPVVGNLGFTEVVIDNSNKVYIGSTNEGVIGYDPANNLFSKVSGNEGAGNLPSDFINSLAIDNSNQLWIGTNRGLRVLYGPSSMFTNPDISADEIIILDSDGVAQELLANTSVTAISVDGNNNKWIGTEAGAFYLSSNGQETIYHFTTENSPLPSNTITDIAIDKNSGKVYIATINGLLAFRGKATAGAEDLSKVRAFPNPVRPHYTGMVTIDGLMENANVKITDIEGNLVYEEVSQGGSIQWDTRAFGKHKVASGVYMVLITSEDQLKTKVAKIMVIR